MSRNWHDNSPNIARQLHSNCKLTQQLMRFGREPALFLSQPMRQWRADLRQRTQEQTRPERDESLDRLALARSFPGNPDPLASFAPGSRERRDTRRSISPCHRTVRRVRQVGLAETDCQTTAAILKGSQALHLMALQVPLKGGGCSGALGNTRLKGSHGSAVPPVPRVRGSGHRSARPELPGSSEGGGCATRLGGHGLRARSGPAPGLVICGAFTDIWIEDDDGISSHPR